MKPHAVRGHLDAMILAVIEHEPRHGYAIMEALHRRSGGVVDVPAGTIYPALRRLERVGHVRSAWSNVSGRDRRTYTLTPEGRGALAKERESWRSLAGAMEGILGNELRTRTT
ncbi:PadR family transcriptional regulator [Actinomadura spongiicola]|uniref:PadR family transcriptional regulator n=1 Tax=Actinomadura spongiicola TaxID=2303421 RepID=A0A372GCH1_9ACTN|nr:helix-turn-helix transcriptional regulator [Actinomadura spongiicola]RFS83017.1 PadR family transcriptional regulator [Actinomadura spongiicola]